MHVVLGLHKCPWGVGRPCTQQQLLLLLHSQQQQDGCQPDSSQHSGGGRSHHQRAARGGTVALFRHTVGGRSPACMLGAAACAGRVLP